MNKQGFAFLMVVAFAGLLSLTVIALYYRTMAVTAGAPLVMMQQQARQQAISGVEIAVAQLQTTLEPDKKNEKKDKKALFIFCNKWQRVTIDEGQISWMITSEDGKINLNSLVDFRTSTFTTAAEAKELDKQKRSIYKFLTVVGKKLHIKQLELELERIYAARKKNLINDVTELVVGNKSQINIMQPLAAALFPDPNRPHELSLFDIFTIYSRTQSLNPLYLSPSLARILDFAIIQEQIPANKLAPQVDKLLQLQVNAASWDEGIGKLYGKPFSVLAPYEKLLNPVANPTVFGVTVVAKVGQAQQKVYAILEVGTVDTQKPRIVIKKIYIV